MYVIYLASSSKLIITYRYVVTMRIGLVIKSKANYIVNDRAILIYCNEFTHKLCATNH